VIDSLDTQVERLAAQLAEDDHRELAALFRQARMAPPQLLWNPQPGQTPAPAMAASLTRWDLHGGRRRAATLDGLVDGAPDSAWDWAMRIELSGDGTLTYARIGHRVVDLLRNDPTGEDLDRILSRNPTPAMVFYTAAYQACRWRQAPLLTFNQSPRLQVRAVSRLVLPLWEPAGVLRHFVTLLSVVDDGEPPIP
jgi:hypothetical protein